MIQKSDTIHYSRCNKDIQYDVYRTEQEGRPWAIFVPGSRSDKEGKKAKTAEKYCQEHNVNFIRFNGDDSVAYAQDPEGKNDPSLLNATITSCKEVLELVINEVAGRDAPILFVCSSMGLWLTLLHLAVHPEQGIGIVSIAGALDSTDRAYNMLSDEEKEALANGEIVYPKSFRQGINKEFIEDGKQYLLLDKGQVELKCPIYFMHGDEDAVVPAEMMDRIANTVISPAKSVELIPGGAHNLSRPEDLEKITLLMDKILSHYSSNTSHTQTVLLQGETGETSEILSAETD